MYEIQKNIPLPAPRHGQKAPKYPFKNMKVGESFFKPTDTPSKTQTTLHSCSRHWADRHNDKAKFATRRVTENGILGVRIWRTK